MRAEIDFCGEIKPITPAASVIIGREGDLVIDDNPYLHRQFIEVSIIDGLCWVANVGNRLTATLADGGSRMQSWLGPGSRLPVVFAKTFLRFTAGPTSYVAIITIDEPPFTEGAPVGGHSGGDTIGHLPLTPTQHLLIVALAEPTLRQVGRGQASLPASAAAARRLGWSTTKFTRKLDNVCERLAEVGVSGLRGDLASLAANRRARLVEYALSVGLVVESDLAILDEIDRQRAEGTLGPHGAGGEE